MSDVKQNQPNQDAMKHQQGQKPGQGSQGQVGKDTDNDGRVVKPGHKPGEVDGDRQRQQNQQRRG